MTTAVPILAVSDDAKDAAAVVLRFSTTVLADVRRVRSGRIAAHRHVADTAPLGALPDG